MRTLQVGCSGYDVQQLQTALNKEIGCALVVDGIFGTKTKAAVKDYQRAHPPLAVDGLAGPKTLTALKIVVDTACEIKCENLKQFASPHGSMIYGPNSSYSTYASGGCGVTSFAIVYRALGLAPSGETATQTIQRLGKYAWEHGYRPKGNGTNVGLLGTNGVSYKSITAGNIESTIRGGNLVVLRIKNGFGNGYTGSGHYIVAYGIKDGYVLLRDVGSSSASRQRAKLASIGNGVKGAYKMSLKK